MKTIYEQLETDHREVLALLNNLIELDDKDEERFELAEQIRDALIPHSRAEEAVFYNAIRAKDADSGKVLHGYKEHAEAEAMLRVLLLKEKTKLDWKKTAKSLREALEHHISEEETEIFALGKKVLTTDDAEKIAVAFNKIKTEINAKSMIASSMDLIANLLPVSESKVKQKIDQA